jgi:5-oxoprolinase (ATP-hydrolysing) subunit A
MLSVDLNCDMGESFGPWRMGNDAELMKYVSSVNIACGFHAGDPSTMRKTVQLAIQNGIAIGAHPGYPDLQGFGRRNMAMSPAEIYDILLYQISALKGICEAQGARLNHVKPHGALYNQAAKDRAMSRAIADAVVSIDPSLVLYGLSGSHLIAEAEAAGLKTASEAFADRTYQKDGTLMPRTLPNAVIADTKTAAAQALQMVTAGSVKAVDETIISIKADTICIHGDGENALEFAGSISSVFARNGIIVTSI